MILLNCWKCLRWYVEAAHTVSRGYVVVFLKCFFIATWSIVNRNRGWMWPPRALAAARSTSPLSPRIQKREAIERTVLRGVEDISISMHFTRHEVFYLFNQFQGNVSSRLPAALIPNGNVYECGSLSERAMRVRNCGGRHPIAHRDIRPDRRHFYRLLEMWASSTLSLRVVLFLRASR